MGKAERAGKTIYAWNAQTQSQKLLNRQQSAGVRDSDNAGISSETKPSDPPGWTLFRWNSADMQRLHPSPEFLYF